MTQQEKIAILEEILGAQHSWVIQLKQFSGVPDNVFDQLFWSIKESVLLQLEKEKEKIQKSIDKLQEI